MERTTAIFHASDRLQEAVHELEERGVVPERIHADAEPAPRAEPAPHALFGIPFGVHYAGAGAAIGMVVGLAMSGAADAMTTMWLVLVFTGIGSLLGAFVGVSVGGLRKLRWEERVTPHRFVLWVDTETPAERDVVTRTIESYGGETTATP